MMTYSFWQRFGFVVNIGIVIVLAIINWWLVLLYAVAWVFVSWLLHKKLSGGDVHED